MGTEKLFIKIHINYNSLQVISKHSNPLVNIFYTKTPKLVPRES
jgi:hypothetical protein